MTISIATATRPSRRMRLSVTSGLIECKLSLSWANYYFPSFRTEQLTQFAEDRRALSWPGCAVLMTLNSEIGCLFAIRYPHKFLHLRPPSPKTRYLISS
jgi:hypothetical protein